MPQKPFVRVGILFVVLVALSSAASAAERLCDASYENCRTPLLELIQAETVGIDVAFWFMEDARYSAAIIDRWRAGVPVRLIVDTRANASYPLNAAILQDFKDAGIPMLNKTSSGIVHWKTMIFAGQHIVEFSGANFSPHAFVPLEPYVDYIDEVIYFSDDPAIVNSFKTKYDDVWISTSGYTPYANMTTARTRRYPVFAIASELNFVPFQNFATRSIGLYDKEASGIDAIMFRITDRQHTDALIRAMARGVRVRLITDEDEYRDPTRFWHAYNVDILYAAGAQVRLEAHRGGLHQKTTLLRSQQTAVFGSSNWTSPSARSQLEHNIFTKRPWVYQFFSDQFARKWNNETGNVETKPLVPLPPDPPQPVAPANAASGQPLTVTLQWYAGVWAHKYDIYFGTTAEPTSLEADVALGPSTSHTDYVNYTVTGLEEGTTYYWRIVSKTMANVARSGPIWNFHTTGAAASAGDGDVVLYAADAVTRAGRWSVVADATAAGGARMQTQDAGVKLAAAANPADYFEMTFIADAGVPYHLWMRGRAQRDYWGNDSAYVQFSDSVTPSGAATSRIGTSSAATVMIEDCSGCGLSGWGWNDNAFGAVGSHVYFATSGEHRLRIQMREDGLSIDQIVLSRGSYLTTSPGATKNDGTILQPAGGTTGDAQPAPDPLPAGWQSADIGAVGPAGSASLSGGSFTVRGAGADVWGTVDAFQYAFTTFSGDVAITARVAAVSGTQAWTKVGVMIRDSGAANAAHAFMLVSSAKGLAFQRRTTAGALSTHTGAGAGTAPRWVRLSRVGNTITAYVSSDGTTWSQVAGDTFSMSDNVLIGLAVSSHDTSVLATGLFDSVSITSGGAAVTTTNP